LAGESANNQKGGWLDELRAGDQQAFAGFVDKYKATVFLCCRTLGLKDDEVQDVAAETFLAAYSGLKRYSGRAKLGTWLWKIAYYKSISFIRKKGRRAELLRGFAEHFADKRNNAKESDKEPTELVWAAVRRLPKLWAIAIVLFYREGKSIKEIAKIMRKRENTVKTYLFRARKELKQILGPILEADIDAGG
jgi:RNA polymerase sigma factor (sigma-70 family)